MEVLFTADAHRELDRLPMAIRVRIDGLAARLERWPNVSGVRQLTGKRSGRYRMRTGDYRLQFRIETNVIVVEKVGHRDGFYEQ